MARAVALVLLLAAGCAAPDDGVPPTPRGGLSPDAEREFIQPPSTEIRSAAPSADYPLNFCVVTREDLVPGGTVAVLCDGVEVQFCCAECVGRFRADPGRYMAVVREAMAMRAAR